jgi:hypothetical protein
MDTEDKKLQEGVALNIAAISTAKRRLDWVRSNRPVARPAKSWRIVMEFDENGRLLKCWETSFDKAGKELINGGISRVDEPARKGTTKCKGFRLSPVQINALLAAVNHKMARSALGWLCDINGPDEPALLFRVVTIRSLHKSGLLDANFTDVRVHGGDSRSVQTLDGAVHEHSLSSPKTPKFQVWTSALGKQLLKDLGSIDENELRYH